jgi:cytosine/uracil/thiamine/allantoin permease
VLWVDLVWGAIILAFLGFEFWTIKNKVRGDTFTERVRFHFKVSGRKGAFAFLAVLGFTAAWFAAHIVEISV